MIENDADVYIYENEGANIMHQAATTDQAALAKEQSAKSFQKPQRKPRH